MHLDARTPRWGEVPAELAYMFDSEAGVAPVVRMASDFSGAHVEGPLDRNGKWAVWAYVSLKDGEAIITELHIRPIGDGPTAQADAPPGGLTGADMRVPWASLLTGIRQWAMARALAEASASVHGSNVRRAGAVWRDAVRRDAARRSRKQQTETDYAVLAQRYAQLVGAGSPKPTAVLAEETNYSPVTVNQRIREARRMGLLTEAPRGKAGGRLTQKARDVLAGVGEAEDVQV